MNKINNIYVKIVNEFGGEPRDARDLEKVVSKDDGYWVTCDDGYENFLANPSDIEIIEEWNPEIIETADQMAKTEETSYTDQEIQAVQDWLKPKILKWFNE